MQTALEINQREAHGLSGNKNTQQYTQRKQTGAEGSRTKLEPDEVEEGSQNLLRLKNEVRRAFAAGEYQVSIFFNLENAYDMTWKYNILKDL